MAGVLSGRYETPRGRDRRLAPLLVHSKVARASSRFFSDRSGVSRACPFIPVTRQAGEGIVLPRSGANRSALSPGSVPAGAEQRNSIGCGSKEPLGPPRSVTIKAELWKRQWAKCMFTRVKGSTGPRAHQSPSGRRRGRRLPVAGGGPGSASHASAAPVALARAGAAGQDQR